MKRVITLLLAAVMVIGTAGLASAVEFKASGHMQILMGVKDNTAETGFNKDVAEDNFYAGQRFRPKLTMSAEGVTAVFEAQQHQAYWGKDWKSGGNPDISGSGSGGTGAVRIRQAYIDFKLPSTPVSLKVGYQQLNLPSIWGNPVFEARVGGVVASIPFNDQAALNLFYARPDQDAVTYSRVPKANGRYEYEPNRDPSSNSTDMFGAMLPLDFGTVQLTPYVVYAKVGYDAGSTAGHIHGTNDQLIIGGLNLEVLPVEALSIKFDAIVTNYKSDADDFALYNAYDPDTNGFRDYGTGWMVGAAIDYEMPWGTPGAFAWYMSGADDKGEGALYGVACDGFTPTSFGLDGYNTFALGDQVSTDGLATMGLGLQIADMSFIDSLKHTVRVAYIRGTNDKDIKQVGGGKVKRYGYQPYWTEKDSFFEVNLDSTWSIYENLAAVVELGGLLPDLSSETKKTGGYEDDFAWRAQVTFRFSF